MGPRSENRGYRQPGVAAASFDLTLQWVHGPRTVVIQFAVKMVVLDPVASMGPRSENRGYPAERLTRDAREWASMGPRSENRGYLQTGDTFMPDAGCFNGSTVREPWLSANSRAHDNYPGKSFNGSTVREPWLSGNLASGQMCERHRFNGSTVREPWLSTVRGVTPAARAGFNGSTVREPWLS